MTLALILAAAVLVVWLVRCYERRADPLYPPLGAGLLLLLVLDLFLLARRLALK